MTRICAIAAMFVLALSAIFTPAAARGLGSHPLAKPLSIGLVLDIGGVNDKGFNHLAYTGVRDAISKYHGSASYLPSKSPADYLPSLTRYARLHPTLIVGTGIMMSNDIYNVARQHRNQKFAYVDAEPTDAHGAVHNLPNIASLVFHEQEAGYLAGVIAGLMEKHHIGKARHNVIAAMGGLPVPGVVHYIAGYVAGARKVDPSVKVLVGYSHSFTDRAKGHQLGRTQIAGGADILFGVGSVSGLGYLAAARQAGVYGIGVDADQGYLGKYILTSALKRVDLAVFDTIRDVIAGRFTPGTRFFTVKNGGVGLGKPSSIVPAFIVRQANNYRTLIRLGKIVPPVTIPR